MPSNRLQREALNDSYRASFVKLFTVLLSQPTDPGAYDRFVGGVKGLNKMYERASELLGLQGGEG